MKDFIKGFFSGFFFFIVIPASLTLLCVFFSYRQFTVKANANDTTSNLPIETTNLINELKDEYGFNIHIGVNPADYQNPLLNRLAEFTGKYYYAKLDLDQERVYNFLSEFKRVLDSYDKEDLEEIPREIFLTNHFYQKTENNMMTNFSIGLTVSVGIELFDHKFIKPIYLIFSVADGGLSYEHIIEHEFMHCFATKFDKTTEEKIQNLNLNCNDISEYACKNDGELIAEAYAEKIIDRELINK